MIALLDKIDGSEGFHQIVDFLNASHIRKYLQLADAGGLSSLPNTEIFDQLSLMEVEIPQSNFPTQTLVADEAAFTGVDVVHGGVATTVSSIDAGQGSGNITKSHTMPDDSPLPGGHTPGKILSNQGWSLIEVKWIGCGISLVTPYVKLGMDSYGQNLDTQEGFGASLEVTTADAELNTASTFVSTASPQRHADTTTDDLTLTETLIEIRKSAAKAKGKAKMDETESPRKMKQREQLQSFVPMGSELEVQRLKRAGQEVLEEPVKRQKIGKASGSGEESAEKEKELSEEELQKLLVIVPVEEVYVEALQFKYPIIDWEVYSEDTRRDDLVKLWDLVKERFSTIEPIDDKEKELWVELKRLLLRDLNGEFVAFGGSPKGGKITERLNRLGLNVLLYYSGYKLLDEKSKSCFKESLKHVSMYRFDLKNVVPSGGSGPDWLFDIDLLKNSMNYEPITAGNQTNKNVGIKYNVDAVPTQQYIMLLLLYDSPQSSKDAVADDAGKKTNKEPANEGERNGQEKEGGASNKEGDQNVVSTVSPSVSAAGESFTNADDLPTDPLMPDLEDTVDLLNTGIFSGAYDDEDEGAEVDLNNLETTMNVSSIPTTIIHKDHPKEQIIGDIYSATQTRRMNKISEEHAMVMQRDDGIFISQDKYVADILKKFDFSSVKTTSTPIETNKALHKDEESVNDWIIDRIFRYLKGQPKLGLCYTRDSPFDLEAFSDSDYAGASLDRKSTTGEPITVLSSSQLKKTYKPRKAKRTTKISQSSRPIHLVADETIYKEWEDIMERAATTTSSLEAKQDSGNINRTQSMATLNEPLPQGTGLGIDPSTVITTWCALLGENKWSDGFHQIVDVLMLLHQTASINTLNNGEQEITALRRHGHVKTVIIASVRKYLQLADAGGLRHGEKLRYSPTYTNVADEAAVISMDIVHGGAATTVFSIIARHGSGNIPKSPTMPYDSPLPRGHTPGSDEGSRTLHEFTVLCTKLSNKVDSLETELKQTKQTYGAALTKLIKKVKKLEQTVKTSQARRRAKIVVLDDEESSNDTSKQGRMIEDIDQDAGISLVTLTKVSSQEDQSKDQLGVLSAAKVLVDTAKKNVNTYTRRRRAVSTGSEGVGTASKIFSTAEESVSIVGASMPVSTAEQEELLASETTENEANPPLADIDWDDVQYQIQADKDLTQKLQKTREGLEPTEELKADEISQEDLQQIIMVVPVEEVYVKALQVKYPIIDWEVYSEDTRKYWKIIRVGNHIEAYQTFDDMLKKFDRDDLEYIHDPLTWRLYDTCGVHHVSTDKGHDIFMLVEKDYPLTRGLLTLMLSNKLQVDQYSGMADELLRKIVILENRPRHVPIIIRSDTLLSKYDIFYIIMVNVIYPDHVDDVPVVEPNQHDDVPVVPEPVLVDEDEDPKEDEFEEEEDPQEEEDDMEVDIEEDENEPELT
ncbi:hypothetical protein Tco_1577997 [Tanacetum coccineum]